MELEEDLEKERLQLYSRQGIEDIFGALQECGSQPGVDLFSYFRLKSVHILFSFC